MRVTLAAGETARTDEQPVDAAKAVLVQVATFGSDTATPADNPEPVAQNYNALVDADSYTLE